MKKYYYIEKRGVYGQGVFWIGEDKDEGLEKLKELVESDSDDYHSWDLGLFEDKEFSLIQSLRKVGGIKYG